MIRPWYRSRLFWLGVMGLVFLLWLWVDSMRYDTMIDVYWKDHGWGFFSAFSELKAGAAIDPFFVPTGGLDFEVFRSRVYLGPDVDYTSVDPFENSIWPGTLAEAMFPGALGRPSAVHTLGLAYWLITLVYLSGWAGSLIVWQRWKRRRLLDGESGPVSG